MKPGEETPQNWQPPAQSLGQAPYQAPAQEPIVAPVAPQPVQQTPVTLANPLPVTPVSPAEPIQSGVMPQATTIPSTNTVPSADSMTEAVDETTETDLTGPDAPAEDASDDTALLRWQATEYIHHERTGLWYAVLGLVVVAFIALAIFVFNSITFAILIPVMLVSLVVYVRRPPSVLNYTLSRKGLHVNDRLYTYDQFKAFGVITHENAHSVVLLPRKRFQVSQTVYFPEEVGEPLVDMIAARLPMQEVELDAIDKLLKKLRI